MTQRQEFPKWKYHATQSARIVSSAAEEAALGGDWYNSPADVPTVAVQEPVPNFEIPDVPVPKFDPGPLGVAELLERPPKIRRKRGRPRRF